MKDFTVYKRIKFRDCYRLPSGWDKLAWCSYTKFRKRAEKENPPGHYVLLTALFQFLVSKDRTFMDKAVELVKGNVPEDCMLCWTGSALCDGGYYEEGLERLRKAVSLNPSPTNMEALAGAIERPEDYDEKLEISNQMLEKNPNDADALRHKAFVLVQRNNLDEAEELVRKALEICPENMASRQALGEILFQRGMYKDALRLYKKAFSYFHNSKRLWQQIALCYLELGKPKKAKKAAYKLLKLAKKGGDDLNSSSMKALFGKFGIAL
jgi:tetratricopeptide (TPR) repeat protein